MLRGIHMIAYIATLVSSGGFRQINAADGTQTVGGSRVTLIDNGYRNLVIAINDRVQEDPQLIDRIKAVFKDTSRFLYSATKQRAYFNDIRILIPESWSDSDTYTAAQDERYDSSDIRIDHPSEDYGDLPYTNKPTPCGISGLYIHLTPSYLTDENVARQYGEYEKVLVHEWGHYRWGVFDEYPLPGMAQFYAASNGDIEAVRCVLAIPGVPATIDGESCTYNANGLPNGDCTFVDDRFADGYTGSLMYKQFLPKITTFCEAEPTGSYRGNVHNREAPNRQNLLCDGRSIWEVMLEHKDFADDANPSRDNPAPDPTFTMVKKYNSRLVLVLDMSGSMKGEKLRQLRQAASNLITNTLRDGEQLGIVTFSNNAYIAARLTTISNGHRQYLLSKLPTLADGATSIGAGVTYGLDVLEGSQDVTACGRLLVITDGEENTAPYISDIKRKIRRSCVRIDTIAIGETASRNLETLAMITGGTSYYHSNTSNTLNEAFSELTRNDRDNSKDKVVDLLSNIFTMSAMDTVSGEIYIDSSIGRNTHFSFGYSLDEGVNVTLTSPSGMVFDKQSAEYTDDEMFGWVRIDIQENAEIGKWTFKVLNIAASDQRVTVSVDSQSRDDEEPIITDAKWGNTDVKPPENQILYVTVAKGYAPVVNSHVEASVSVPSNDNVDLLLMDNGIGADIISNDGVYSTFFTDFSGLGRYSVQVNVQSQETDTYIATGGIIGHGAVVDPQYDTTYQQVPDDTRLVSTGVFQRVTNGGSFTCNVQEACTGTADIYPPSRISDLVADSVQQSTVKLTFTAPGDDLTSGSASYYIIRMGTNFTEFYENVDVGVNITNAQLKLGDLYAPKPSGSKETFVVKVAEMGDFSYIFGIIAVDDEDNISPRSNLATSSANAYRRQQISYAWLGVGCGITLILIIAMIVCVVFIVFRRSRKDRGQQTVKTKAIRETAPPGDEHVADYKPGYAHPNSHVGLRSINAAITAEIENRAYVTV